MRQMARIRGRLAAGTFLVLAVVFSVAGFPAPAEAHIATLHASPRTVAAGSTVTLRGANYNDSGGNIEVRVDTRSGPVIASFPPRRTLDDVPVPIPRDLAPGLHTLLALQRHPDGTLGSGGPGRATVVVTAPAASASQVAPAAPADRSPVVDVGLLAPAAARSMATLPRLTLAAALALALLGLCALARSSLPRLADPSSHPVRRLRT